MARSPVIPAQSTIGQLMAKAARDQRLILFSGLPGVGKSLFLQQQVMMAVSAGRKVHLLQWDVAREPFERPDRLARFPEVDGSTHPAIRRAVGLWVRPAVARWDRLHPDDRDILIGEIPIVGGRLVELVQTGDDDAEALLAGSRSMFFVPVPSRKVRRRIEERRQATIAAPSHHNEARDAPINLVREAWWDLRDRAVELGLATPVPGEAQPDYDPEICSAMFAHLLRHRNHQILAVDTQFPATGSVYDPVGAVDPFRAEPDEVAKAYLQLERDHSPTSIDIEMSRWHRV